MGKKKQGQLTEWLQTGIDPEVRSLAINLVSALGGASLSENGPRYVPGDDALGVLRDLRRWFRQEQAADRLELPRCLAELNFGNDLVGLINYAKTGASSIISVLHPNASTSTTTAAYNNKLLLSAIDLLVAITWPVEIDETRLRKSHFAHIPVIRRAQVDCKRLILAEGVVGAVVITCGKVLQEREENRQKLGFSLHDGFSQAESILRMGLYLIRNILVGSMGEETAEADAQLRSSCVTTFQKEGVFDLILALGSNIDRDFGNVDVILMEILFYLLRGTDPCAIMTTTGPSDVGLRNLLDLEKEIKARETRTGRSRHSRFGGLVWLKEGDKVKTGIADGSNLNSDVGSRDWGDRLKKARPERGKKEPEDETKGAYDFLTQVTLSRDAAKSIVPFLNDFLDSSFNPVFSRLRHAIASGSDRILEQTHGLMFFYLTGWFLTGQKRRRDEELEKRMRQRGRSRPTHASGDDNDDGFSVIASLLSRPTFTLLHSHMEQAVNSHSFMALQAQMRCFSQLLHTVRDMSLDADHPGNVEIAENMQSWMFYDETVHDRLLQILRLSEKRSIMFLDAVTDLVSVFNQMVESWGGAVVAKKVKKRASKKNGSNNNDNNDAEAGAAGSTAAATAPSAGGEDDESEDERDHELVTRERKFDAHKFSVRMSGDTTIRVFAAFLKHHEDLSAVQLKRCHRFFYRVAFKLGLGVHLWRVSLVKLFWEVGKRGRAGSGAGMGAGARAGTGTGELGSSSSVNHIQAVLAEWNVLAIHLFRSLVKLIEKRPEALVEMLFAKTSWSWLILEHGYDYQGSETGPGKKSKGEKEMRLTGPYEFKPLLAAELDQNQRVGVAVMVLGKNEIILPWLDSVLDKAKDGTENASSTLHAETDEQRACLAWNGHLHLLLTELGFKKPGFQPSQVEGTGVVISPEDGSASVPRDVTEEDPATTEDVPPTEAATLPADSSSATGNSPYWTLPDSPSAALLLLTHAVTNPPFEDIKEARKYIRKVPSANESSRSRRRDGGYDSDGMTDGDSEDDSEEEADLELFPLGGPTARKSDVPRRKGKKRLKRKRRDEEDGDEDEDEESRALRAEKRKADAARKELEKRRRIKSSLFVHESDDDDDDERHRDFFAAEEQRRRKAAMATMMNRSDKSVVRTELAGRAGAESDGEDAQVGGQGKKKRIRLVDQLKAAGGGAGSGSGSDTEGDFNLDSDSENDSANEPGTGTGAKSRSVTKSQEPASRPGTGGPIDLDSDSDDDILIGKASSIADRLRAAKKEAQRSEKAAVSDSEMRDVSEDEASSGPRKGKVGDDDDDEEDEDAIVPASGRRRMAGPFVDSSDEE